MKKSKRKVPESSDEDELDRNLPVEILDEDNPQQKKNLIAQHTNAY